MEVLTAHDAELTALLATRHERALTAAELERLDALLLARGEAIERDLERKRTEVA